MNLDSLLRRWFFMVVTACLLLLAVNVLVYLFGVSKLGRTAEAERHLVEKNAKQVEELEAEVAEAARKVASLESGKAVLSTLYAENFKTREERLAETQREVDKLIREAGLTHEGLSYGYEIVPRRQGKSVPPKEYWELRTRISANGSYPQVKQFLGSLQASPHFLVVDDVSLRTSTQGAVLLGMGTTLSTYYLAGVESLPQEEVAP